MILINGKVIQSGKSSTSFFIVLFTCDFYVKCIAHGDLLCSVSVMVMSLSGFKCLIVLLGELKFVFGLCLLVLGVFIDKLQSINCNGQSKTIKLLRSSCASALRWTLKVFKRYDFQLRYWITGINLNIVGGRLWTIKKSLTTMLIG